MNIYSLTASIKEKALSLGFDDVGIAKAEYMDEEAFRLEAWLNQNYHGEMSFLAENFDKRVDPTKLVPGTKSVITLAFNYYNPNEQTDPEAPKIAKYAYGKDYHKVIKKKLKALYLYIKTLTGDIHGRFFVDAVPILERDWAKRSGLGWIGKNSLMINPKRGSYFFLATILLDIPLIYDTPLKDYCGTCTKCIDACPTEAIKPEGYVVDGSKCISYLNIELKAEIPSEFEGKMENWVFGCDICQQVCPWNRFSNPHSEPKLLPSEKMMTLTKSEWLSMDQELFTELFAGRAIRRVDFKILKQTIDFLNKEGID